MAQRIRIAVDVPRELRRKLRLAAAQREVTINEYVREALVRQVEDDFADALNATDDPVLGDLWNNEEDDVYDHL